MTDTKEPGQLAFETREKSHTPSASAMALAHWWGQQDADDRAAWAAVEQAVREQCAQIAEKTPKWPGDTITTVRDIAAAIREPTHD